MSEKASKGRFPKPKKFQNHVPKEKERRKRRSELEGKKEKRKKQWFLVFMIATLGIVFGRKKLLDLNKAQIGGNVFKNNVHIQ